MARQLPYLSDTNDDAGNAVRYSLLPRPERGRWMALFFDPTGKRIRTLTDAEMTGKTPTDFAHQEAKRLVRTSYRPPTHFPSLARKTWSELLVEVGEKYPHTRPETLRSFEAGVKALREIMPEVTGPADMSDERATRFRVLWLAAPSKKGKGGGKRSPTTLSYYLRGLSALTNRLQELGHVNRNVWKGVKAPKGEKRETVVPSEDETDKFFAYLFARYPDWRSLHAFIELKAVSASRTADVCQLKTAQLRDGRLTFSADVVKTKNARSLPLPADLYQTLTEVAGPVFLWEKLFAEIPKYRKASNGYPTAFEWKTVYYVLNNVFREYNDANPDRPRFTPHGLRRRAITLTVQATGSVDAAASAIHVTAQTARKHYLDAQRAFDTDATMRKVAESLRPKMRTPSVHQADSTPAKSPENKP